MKALILLALAAFFLGTAEDCQGGDTPRQVVGNTMAEHIAPGGVEAFMRAVCSGNLKYINDHTILPPKKSWYAFWSMQVGEIWQCDSYAYKGVVKRDDLTATYNYQVRFKSSANEYTYHTWYMTFVQDTLVNIKAGVE